MGLSSLTRLANAGKVLSVLQAVGFVMSISAFIGDSSINRRSGCIGGRSAKANCSPRRTRIEYCSYTLLRVAGPSRCVSHGCSTCFPACRKTAFANTNRLLYVLEFVPHVFPMTAPNKVIKIGLRCRRSLHLFCCSICCRLATRQIQTSLLALTFRVEKIRLMPPCFTRLAGSKFAVARRDTSCSTSWRTPKTITAAPPSNFTRMAHVLDRHTVIHRTSSV